MKEYLVAFGTRCKKLILTPQETFDQWMLKLKTRTKHDQYQSCVFWKKASAITMNTKIWTMFMKVDWRKLHKKQHVSAFFGKSVLKCHLT